MRGLRGSLAAAVVVALVGFLVSPSGATAAGESRASAAVQGDSEAKSKRSGGKAKRCRKGVARTSAAGRKGGRRCRPKKPSGQGGGKPKPPGVPQAAESPAPIPQPAPLLIDPGGLPGPPGPPIPPPVPEQIETVIDSAPPQYVGEREVSFEFSSNRASASFQCRLDAATWQACTSPAVYSGLADDYYTFIVRAVDGADVDPSPAFDDFTVAATAPETTITDGPDGPTGIGPVELGFMSDLGDSFECSLDGVGFAPCESPLQVESGAGAHLFRVRALSLAGVPDPTPASLGWTSVVQRCGSLTDDETWSEDQSLGCDVVVPEGVTLTIEDGVRVDATGGSLVVDGGELRLEGAAASPVRVTAQADPGVALIRAEGYEGALDVSHATVSGAARAILSNADEAALTIADSRLEGGVDISYADPTLVRNTFALPGPSTAPLRLNGAEISDIAFAGPDANVFQGADRRRVVLLESSGVLDGGAAQISSASGAVFLVRYGSVRGSLEILPGTILKVAPGHMTFGQGLEVNGSGELTVGGSEEEPVVFTTWWDDSVGGDSLANGPPPAGAEPAKGLISIAEDAEPGRVEISHAILSNAGRVLEVECSLGYANPAVLVEDSRIEGGLFLEGYETVVRRNTFALSGDELATDADCGYPVPAIHLHQGDPSGIAFTGPDANRFEGDGQSRAVILRDSYLPDPEAEWNFSSEHGAVFLLDGLGLSGDIDVAPGTIVKVKGANSGLSVFQGGTLDVAGTEADPVVFTSWRDDTVGGDSLVDGPTGGFPVQPAGSQIVLSHISSAESEEPSRVTIAHAVMREASNAIAGGCWRSALEPEDGEPNTLEVEDSDLAASVNLCGSGDGSLSARLDGVRIHDTETAIEVGGHDAAISFRGTIEDVGRGIASCNWGTGCSVDAAHVDWGHPRGPFDAEGASLVCGAATVSPWVGQQPGDQARLFSAGNCDGSPTPAELLAEASDAFGDSLSQLRIDCQGGYQTACDQIELAFTCLSAAVDAAGGTSPFPLPPAGSGEDWPGSYDEAVHLAADSAISAAELSTVFSLNAVRQFAGNLIGAVSAIVGLAQAYATCSP